MLIHVQLITNSQLCENKQKLHIFSLFNKLAQ